jgi:Ca2+-binding RTX toxin-like protein
MPLYIGTAGNDTIIADGADDDIQGRAGDDSLIGGGGIDNINGEDGDDTIYGDDVFQIGVGYTIQFGVNLFDTDTAGDYDVIEGQSLKLTGFDASTGIEGFRGYQGSGLFLRATGPAANLLDFSTVTMGAGVTISGDDNPLLNSGGNDTIIGSAFAEAIYGMGGNDSIDGGAGNDTISGGSIRLTGISSFGQLNADDFLFV